VCCPTEAVSPGVDRKIDARFVFHGFYFPATSGRPVGWAGNGFVYQLFFF
jgi:hypothetical protein